MTAAKDRDTVLVVGATGSLGKPIVAELRRRGIKVRLLGRSRESFVEAGYLSNHDGSEPPPPHGFDVAICDVSRREEYRDEWFRDVSCAICVARPRSLTGGDDASYRPMMDNLCDAACVGRVPRLLVLGVPYLERNLFGETRTMTFIQGTEQSAHARFEECASSSLTIARICELSEIGHLVEAVQMMGFFPVALGYNPTLHPISSRDFAVAIANYAENPSYAKTNELLVGGPRQIRWNELGAMVSQERGLRGITLPLFVYKCTLCILGLLVAIFPALKGLHLSLRLVMIPMTTNTANDEFDSVGSDDVATFIRDLKNRKGWVHQKVFGPSSLHFAAALPAPKTLAKVVGVVAFFDTLSAMCKPEFIGSQQNLDVSDTSIDGHLVLAFGFASIGVTVMTFLSLGMEGGNDMKARRSLVGTLVAQLLVLLWIWSKPSSSATFERGNAILLVVGASYVASLILVVVNRRARFFVTAIISSLTIGLGAITYIHPEWVLPVFGVDVLAIGDKTMLHSRQVSLYFIASGVQMLALSLGMDPPRACGLVCSVWSLCQYNLDMFANTSEVFELSSATRNRHLGFATACGLLGISILCR